MQANLLLFPTQAYTMGIKTIMQAKKILVIVSGESKAEILKEVHLELMQEIII